VSALTSIILANVTFKNSWQSPRVKTVFTFSPMTEDRMIGDAEI